MANATETTSAAVWNPPRLVKLNLRGTANGGQRARTTNTEWEGACPPDAQYRQYSTYRLPRSGEVQAQYPFC